MSSTRGPGVTGESTASDGARIGWRRIGGRSGPPIVLVHGIGNDSDCWFDIPERLAAGGAQVLAVDLRGHGRSSRRGPYAIDRFAADLAAVLQDQSIGSPILVGHSLGALVCSALARAPGIGPRAVVNVDQHLHLAAFAEVLRTLWPAITADFHSAIVPVFESMLPGGLPDAQRAALLERFATMNAAAALELWQPLVSLDAASVSALVDQLLNGAQSRYLVIHGSDPGAGYADWLRSRISRSSVEVWDGGAHFPHLAEPERFAALLLTLAVS